MRDDARANAPAKEALSIKAIASKFGVTEKDVIRWIESQRQSYFASDDLASDEDVSALDAELAALPPTRASVYILRSNGLVKIGISTDVRRRLNSLRAQSAVPVEHVYTFPCVSVAAARVLEASLHARFAGQRQHGEWFFLTDAMFSQLLSTEPEADDVARV